MQNLHIKKRKKNMTTAIGANQHAKINLQNVR